MKRAGDLDKFVHLHSRYQLPGQAGGYVVAGAFAGRVVAVTGASSGIGWELARQLGAGGARVGLIARREEPLQQLAGLIRAAGGTAAVSPADVSDHGQTTRAVAAVRDALGPVDLMIANAGVGMPTRLDPVNVADVEAMIRVNVLGVVYAFAAVLPEMLRHRAGHLAAVSSLAGYVALPGESAYCASKAAVNAYLAGLRAHLRGRGVRVTTLCPGFVRTPMTAANDFPMPGLLTAEDAARRMLRALARGRGVYNFPAVTSLLTGLTRWLPNWALGRLMADYNETAAGHGKPG
ncbi:MAG TPA: SDR family NAD(P)-dependent oxidoreductase [Urbifossiella sp.]|jgi:short-subunit dehydrogenase|nr:SDR family NAD(P)-dependent oxidoreductase [Urbifossiella sp.]